jgi:hypothetical protein
MPPETENKVGYGNPPKHSQFKKGQSGNPRGRPRDTENLKMLVGRGLDEKIVLTENGKRSKISLYEAVIKQFVRRSAQGDYRSTRDLIQLVREFEHEARSRKAQETRTGARRGTWSSFPIIIETLGRRFRRKSLRRIRRRFDLGGSQAGPALLTPELVLAMG